MIPLNESMKHPVCLLITACMKPPYGTPVVARPNFSDREKDYIEAFRFYAELGLPIVFVENSNYRCEKIIEIANNHCEFEYFTFQTIDSINGKGHGESEIIKYAFEHSQIIKNSDWIVKITGRYKVFNLMKMINNLSPPEAQVLINWGRNLSLSDTKLIFFRKSFVSAYFLPFMEKYLNENAGMYFETVFARSVHQYLADGHRSGLWPEFPQYFGINGSNGRVVNYSLMRRIKFRFYYRIKRWIYYQMV